MAITIKHAKTDTIADWTQADLDAQIAAGNYPIGTLISDIILPSDWNNSHTITGTIPIANGGTGQTTAPTAINALLPTQSGNANKYLFTDGTNVSWTAGDGTGTVTSVSGTGTVNGLSLTGTVTTSGSLTLGGTLDLSSPPTIGNTTPNTGKFTSVTTPSVTATTTDLTLSAISTGAVNLNTSGGTGFKVIDPSSTISQFIRTRSAASGASGAIIGAASASETDVSLVVASQNAGAIRFSTARLLDGTQGLDQMRVSHTASAVNYVQVTGGATTVSPVISAQGSDANVALSITSKGTNAIRFLSNGATNLQFRIVGTNAAVNNFAVTGTTAGNAPTLSAEGSDTNISMAFQPKGTGAIDLAAGSSGVNISNGGTVTALTRSVSAFNYTSQPTITISAPTTAGGVQATAVQHMYINTAPVANGGTGYTVGDVLTIVGGTPVSTAATLTVSSVSAGVITAVTSTNFNLYSVLPSSPVSVTGGTGTGATFNPQWGNGNSFTITNAGSGYIEQPAVSFSGGGGSGAAAYATVGSGTIVKSLGQTLDTYVPEGIGFRVSGSASTGGAYWQAFAGGTTPILRAVGTTSGYIQTNSAVPIQFGTNAGATNAEQMRVAHTASAVNYVQVTGAATLNPPVISAQGSDSTVALLFQAKGGQNIRFYSASGSAEQFRITHTAGTIANYGTVTGNVAGSAPVFSVAGSDTNIDLALTPKGTGRVKFGTYTATVTAVAGYIEILDAGGTLRKLAVLT